MGSQLGDLWSAGELGQPRLLEDVRRIFAARENPRPDYLLDEVGDVAGFNNVLDRVVAVIIAGAVSEAIVAQHRSSDKRPVPYEPAAEVIARYIDDVFQTGTKGVLLRIENSDPVLAALVWVLMEQAVSRAVFFNAYQFGIDNRVAGSDRIRHEVICEFRAHRFRRFIEQYDPAKATLRTFLSGRVRPKELPRASQRQISMFFTELPTEAVTEASPPPPPRASPA